MTSRRWRDVRRRLELPEPDPLGAADRRSPGLLERKARDRGPGGAGLPRRTGTRFVTDIGHPVARSLHNPKIGGHDVARRARLCRVALITWDRELAEM